MTSIIKTTIIAALSLTVADTQAQERYVTLFGQTSSKLELQAGEVAHLVSFPISINGVSRIGIPASRGISVKFPSGDAYLHQVNRSETGSISSNLAAFQTQDPFEPLVVAGPATLSLTAGGGLATFKITPNTFEADKTIVVPPGIGGGKVQLECSTDLVHWVASTNGIYTNQITAKFFRVKLEKIAP